jgi:hypothetical protein
MMKTEKPGMSLGVVAPTLSVRDPAEEQTYKNLMLVLYFCSTHADQIPYVFRSFCLQIRREGI